MTPSATYISSSDLEDRLETWKAIATLFRDRHEMMLIHGRSTTALAINFGANTIEDCIVDIEKIISDSRGEVIGDSEGSDTEHGETV